MNFKFASSAKPDEEQSRHESNLAREFAQDCEQIRSSSVAATEKYLAAGMDAYLTKPIRPQELDEVLCSRFA